VWCASPTFDWSGLDSLAADSFHFELDRYYNFRSPIFDTSGLESSILVAPSPLGVDSVYYWRFRSFDGFGWSDYSRTFAVYIAGRCGDTGGITGNTNCSEDGKITLSDISRLIDRVYISKLPLCCEEVGNTNGSPDGKLTLSDISCLINQVYISKEPCAPCE
jgi:hypothetical protein